MIYQSIGLLALLAFLYSAFSGRIERTPISGALLYTAFGLLFGSAGLGLFDLSVDAEGLRVIAEITLVIVLFSDAAKVDFGVLQRNSRLPQRLLVIGLPLTILAGFGTGLALFRELSAIEIVILATMLAPTDAALGKAVVADKRVSPPIRTGLNVESGLNDGICVPVLFAFLAMAAPGGKEGGLLHFMIKEISIGLACGIVITFLGVKLLKATAARGWIIGPWRQLPLVALAILCFTAAQLMGGSGFIAAFCGGFLFGRLAKNHDEELLAPTEAVGDMFSMITWTIFGAVVVGPALGALGPDVLLYSVLSLTVIRMLPVFLSLLGTPLTLSEKLFVGWFGPRGLASIVFVVIVLGEHLPNIEKIAMTVVTTVLLSVILHGVSANPLVKAMARKNSKAG